MHKGRSIRRYENKNSDIYNYIKVILELLLFCVQLNKNNPRLHLGLLQYIEH